MVKSTDGVNRAERANWMAAWRFGLPGRSAGLHALSVAARAEDVKYGYPPTEPSAILNFVIKYGRLAAALAALLNVAT